MNNKAYIFSCITIGTLVGLASCSKSGSKDGSEVNYLDQALRIGGANMKKGDKEVLVYYANETAPTGADLANSNKVISSLKSNKRTARVAANLEKDRAEFVRIVDQEVTEMTAYFCSGENTSGASLVIFDNRSAKTGTFRYCEAGKDLKTVESREFGSVQQAASGDYRIASHPLTSKAGLLWSLGQVKKMFPGSDVLVSLIVRSHGTDEREILMTPRLALQVDKLSGSESERTSEIVKFATSSVGRSRQAMRATCGAPDSGGGSAVATASIVPPLGMDKDGFDKDGFDKNGFDKDGFDKNGFDKDGFDKDGFDKNGFDKAGFSKTAFEKSGFDKGNTFFSIADLAKNNPGTTKDDFLNALAASGQRFGLVATLACYSSWREALSRHSGLPIEWIVGADEKDRVIPYVALNWKAFVDSLKSFDDKNIASELKGFLAQASQKQKAAYEKAQSQLCTDLRR